MYAVSNNYETLRSSGESQNHVRLVGGRELYCYRKDISSNGAKALSHITGFDHRSSHVINPKSI
jgi:hypothetical protein